VAKELLPGFFQLRIPLPNSPLKHLNSYLILHEDHFTLVDTGLNDPRTYDELRRQLSEIGLQAETLTSIILTHFHIDHAGLISKLRKASNAKLMLHNKEVELSKRFSSNSNALWAETASFFETNGVHLPLLKQMRKANPRTSNPDVYAELAKTEIPLKGGEAISVGQYCFQAIWTPGHSPGHVCLYEPKKHILVAGDHLLPTITPNVSQSRKNGNPLTDYLNSLEKIEELSVSLVLPAHEEAFTNHSERIRQLRLHHQKRAQDILNQLQKQELTAYQVSSKIQWDVPYPSWNDFPPLQKYLAIGEVIAHLKLLQEQGLVKRIQKAGVHYYAST